MQNPRLASRYAKSILDLAVERNCLEAVLTDMRLLQQICKVSADFDIMLRSPVVKGDKKTAVINAVLKGRGVNEITTGFISLLVAKTREMYLPEIATAFIARYNEMKRIKTVHLTTARPINDAIKKSIEQKVAAFMPGDTMNVETKIDESLIGGFVLEIEGKLFDASIKKSLNDVRAKIIDNSYVSKV